MLDVVGVDVREGRPLAAASLVGVAGAALGALAHHQIGLGARRAGGAEDERDEERDQLFGAHSVIHWTMAAISSDVRHCAPLDGEPGQPFGISTPEMFGPPSILRTR